MARSDSTSVALPAGSGFSAGLGESFSVDLNTGQGLYSWPISAPSGVGGLTPTLKLEYASAYAHGPFGLGWRLPLREITRSLDVGLPEVGDEVERFLDGGAPLVALSDGTFRAAREALYSRYERRGEGWVVTERTGVRHELGLSSAARLADPAHPARVWAWRIERTVDLDGNVVEYRYADGELEAVEYGGYRVAFRYGPRHDVRRSGRLGFVTERALRCDAIALTLGERRLRTIELGYAIDPLNGASLLSSVRTVGHGSDGVDVAGRPMRFRYGTLEGASVAWVEGPAPALSDDDVALVMLDDVALPGVLQVVNGRHVYWPNEGQLRFGAGRPVSAAPHVRALGRDGVALADMNANGTVDLVVSGGAAPLAGYYENAGGARWSRFVAYPRGRRAAPALGSAAVRSGDLDGDGRVDAIAMRGRALVTHRNLGEQGWSGPLVTEGPGVDLGDPLVRLADLTGDGLPDLVRLRPGALEYWPNLGRGRFGARVVLPLALAAARPEELVLADLDGDGVADLARVSAAGVEVWINQGGAKLGAPRAFPVIPPPIPGTVRAADLRGRGRDALVWTSLRAGKPATVCWELGRGEAACHRLVEIDHGTGLVSTLAYATSVDEALRDRAEGRAWGTHLPFPVTVVSATREHDALTGRVTAVDYRYHEGHFEPTTRQFQGFARVEKIERGDAAVPERRHLHVFASHTDPALAGLLLRLETYGAGSARPLRVEESEVRVRSLEGRRTVEVMASRVRHLEGSEDERVDERRFAYDDVGNVVREERRFGGTRGGAPVSEVVEVTELAYARNDARGILDRVARVVRRDGAGRVVAEARKYYDGEDFVGLPLGRVERGHEVRVEKLALERAEYDAHYAGLDGAALGYVEGADVDGAPAVFVAHERAAFDARGVRVADMDPLGRVTRRRYDARGLFVVALETPLGTTRLEVDEGSGHPVRTEDPDGTVVRLAYDGLGRVLAAWLPGDPDDAPTRTYTHDDAALPAAVYMATRLEVGAAPRAETAVYFDGAGRELQRRVRAGAGRVIVSAHVERGPGGLTVAEYEPTFAETLDYAAVDVAGRLARRFRYDGLGRTTQVVGYDGGVSTAVNTPFAAVLTDAEGHRREEHFDAAHRRVRVVEAGSSETRYTFDDVRLTVHDARGRVGTWVSDRLGRRLAVDHRDGGTRRLARDGAGRVVRARDGRGHEVSVRYDPMGRLLEVSDRGVVQESYTYDPPGPGGWNRLASAAFPGGREEWRYDERGQVSEQLHFADGHAEPWVTRFARDALGHERRAELPGGAVVDTEYADNGLVTRVPGFVDRITYDARCLPVAVHYANGVVTELEYSPGPGRVIAQRTAGPRGERLADDRFTLDRLGRLRAVEDAVAGARDEYEFDELGQLTRAGEVQYEYIERELVGLGELSAALELADPRAPGRVTAVRSSGGSAALTYDADGGLLALPGRRLSYDYKHQLVRCERYDGTVAEYGYDHRGRRRRKVVTRGAQRTETIILDERVEIRDGQVAYYVSAGGLRVALVAGGRTRYLHTDHLGSVRFFSDERGTRIAAIVYHPFGNARSTDGAAADLRLFALHPYDEEAGLYHMGRRHYAPELGRFTTPDPKYLLEPDLERADTRTLALYTYCANDPVDLVDPSGLSVASVIGAIVGAAAGLAMGVLLIAAIAAGGWLLITLAVVGIVAVMAVGYLAAAATSGGVSEFFRGFLIGFAAGVNTAMGAFCAVGVLTFFGVGVFTAIGVGIGIGIGLGVINILAAADTVSQSEVYQGILGWSSWFMPTTWLINGAGLAGFLISGVLALVTANQVDALAIKEVSVDWKTGSFFLKGGAIASLNKLETGFNLGHLSFVHRNNTIDMDHVREHEAGHALSLSAFGSVFHLVGAIDEAAVHGVDAFAEQIAEGNVPFDSPGRPKHPMWS